MLSTNKEKLQAEMASNQEVEEVVSVRLEEASEAVPEVETVVDVRIYFIYKISIVRGRGGFGGGRGGFRGGRGGF